MISQYCYIIIIVSDEKGIVKILMKQIKLEVKLNL